MKLRNKKTGETAEIILNLNESLPDAIRRTIEEAGWEKAKEPLIKDEKVRKAVKAWAEANELKPNYEVEYDADMFSLNSWQAGINFNCKIGGLEHNKTYTIAELCGEEEESVRSEK